MRIRIICEFIGQGRGEQNEMAGVAHGRSKLLLQPLSSFAQPLVTVLTLLMSTIEHE